MIRSPMIRLLVVFIGFTLNACSGISPTAIPATLTPTLIISLQTHIDARCGEFSDDNALMLSYYDGLYSLQTGEQLYSSNNLYFNLTTDRQYAAVDSQGVVEVSTGELLFPLAPNEGGVAFFPFFSPDDTMVVAYDGVYAVPSGEQILSWSRENVDAVFSPDSRYLVLLGEGVYDLETGELYFATDAEYDMYDPMNLFSVNGTRLAISGDGFYDMTTGTLLLNLPGDFSLNADETMISTTFGGVYYTATGEHVVDAQSGFNIPALNPDNTLAAISIGDVFSEEEERVGGVYDLTTGEHRFTYNSTFAEFSASGNYLVAADDGVYDVASGERLYELGENEGLALQPNADRYRLVGQGVYDLATRELIYPISGNFATFSPDGSLLFLEDGVHDAATGALLLGGITGGNFNADFSLLAVDTAEGCDIYHVQPIAAISATP